MARRGPARNPLAEDLDEVLAATAGLWEDMRGERVFITGGTGFVGCWMLESFLWANTRLRLRAKAVVLTRDPEAFRHKAAHLADDRALSLHAGDVRTFDFPPGDFRFVIHAATDAHVPADTDGALRALATIVGGTRRVLRMTRDCHASRLLFTSSGAVYGPQPHDIDRISEEHRGAPDSTEPRSAYGEGKRVAELLACLHARRDGFEVAIARCFAFIGPYLPLDGPFAAGNFVRDRLASRAIAVGGDGTPRRSYLYASDLAAWLWTMLFRAPSGRAYNVGSDQGMSVRELAALIATSPPGPSVAVEVAGAPDRGALVQRYVPDTRRIAAELGLVATIGIEDAIARTLRWHSRRT